MERRPTKTSWTGARRVAVGGMAEIWLAHGPGGEPVALKRLVPALADRPEIVRAFLEEARVLALLDHPNVLRLVGRGVDDGPFLAVEWVDGVDLARVQRVLRARRQAAPLGFVALVARDLLAALAHVHGARDSGGRPLGLIHRDVSPQNLLVGRSGACTLIDFGVAKRSGRNAVTGPGTIQGKVAYLAPEQLEDGPIDGRVDLFAAGAVLFELASGAHPFQGRCEGATLRAIAGARPQAPSCLRQEVPDRFSAAVLRALARSPDDRFPGADAFAAEALGALPAPFTPPEVRAFLSDLFPLGLPHERPEAPEIREAIPDVFAESERVPPPLPRRTPAPLGRLQLVKATLSAVVPGDLAPASSVEFEPVTIAATALPREAGAPASRLEAPPAGDFGHAPAREPARRRPFARRARPATRPDRPPVLHPVAPRDPAARPAGDDGGAGLG